MPDGPKYYQKIYSNLVEYYGKESVPSEQVFYQKLSNSDYRKGVFSNLVQAYGQDALPSYNDFEKRISAPTPIDVSPRPAKRAEGLPTFAEQQQGLAAYNNPYERAIQRDKASWSTSFKVAYNGLVGSAERLLGGIIEIAPTPYSAMPSEFVKAQKAAAKEDITKAFDVVQFDVPESQQAALNFDIKRNSIGNNVKALVSMTGPLVGDIGLGAVTGGTSFFVQGYNDGVNDYDANAKKAGVIPNDASRAIFGAANGTINGLLERFALNKIFGSGPAFKNLQRKVLVETFDEVTKGGKTLTIEAIQKVAEKKVRAIAASVRTKGVKTVYASTVEGGTEALQSALTDIAKNITNEVENRKVFDNVGLQQSIDNFINNAAAGFVLGSPLGLASSFNTNIDNQLLKDIAKADTPDKFETITRDLTQTFEKSNIPVEQRQAILDKMAEYVDVKNTIPAYTPAEAQQKVIPIIIQRRAVDQAISEKEAAIEKLDESLKDDVQMDIAMLRDRRSYMNDQIRESVSEDKFSYFEEDGKFFKRLGENKPEEISKNYYEMAFVGEKQQADKPAPTDKNITPFIVVDGETYTGKDHGEAMDKARESGENVPDPATEEGKIWREENGLFKDAFGQTLTRDESQEEYGIRRSAEIIEESPRITKKEIDVFRGTTTGNRSEKDGVSYYTPDRGYAAFYESGVEKPENIALQQLQDLKEPTKPIEVTPISENDLLLIVGELGYKFNSAAEIKNRIDELNSKKDKTLKERQELDGLSEYDYYDPAEVDRMNKARQENYEKSLSEYNKKKSELESKAKNYLSPKKLSGNFFSLGIDFTSMNPQKIFERLKSLGISKEFKGGNFLDNYHSDLVEYATKNDIDFYDGISGGIVGSMNTKPQEIIEVKKIAKEIKKEGEPEPKGYAASTMQKIRREEALKTIDEIGTPIDARQAAWLALAQGAKIGRESFIRETRLGQGEVLKNKLLLKGGQTIEKASESIHSNLPDEMQDVIYQPDIRNELIDLIQTYNTKEEARQAYIEFYSKRLSAVEDIEERMAGIDEVILLDDIAYYQKDYDSFLRGQAELEEAARISDEYTNILMEENEQDAKREGVEAAPETEGQPVEPVVSPISTEEAGQAVGEYVRRFGTDEEIPAFDQLLKSELEREGFDAEYRENRRAAESKEEYIYRKYCK
jgi:hypothetical protein